VIAGLMRQIGEQMPEPRIAHGAQQSGRPGFCSGGLLAWCQVAVPDLEQAVEAVAEKAGGEQR
jgi:hypothetical protein